MKKKIFVLSLVVFLVQALLLSAVVAVSTESDEPIPMATVKATADRVSDTLDAAASPSPSPSADPTPEETRPLQTEPAFTNPPISEENEHNATAEPQEGAAEKEPEYNENTEGNIEEECLLPTPPALPPVQEESLFAEETQGQDPLTDEPPFATDDLLSLATHAVNKPIENDDPSISEIIVFDVMYNESLVLAYLECGKPFASLNLETQVLGFASDWNVYPLPITWDYQAHNSSKPGRYTLTGTVLLPDGFISGKGKPLTVTKTVIVYEKESEGFLEILACYYHPEGSVIIPLGTAKKDLPSYFNEINAMATLVTVYEDYISCPISVDYDKIDPSKAGIYYPLVLDLPPGVTIKENKALCVAVHVVPTEKVTLDAISADRDGYLVKWFTPIAEPTLWVSVDDGPWENRTEYGYFNSRYDDDRERRTSLNLNYGVMQPGKLYRFKVQDRDGVFSDILTMDFRSGKSPHIDLSNEGDRTGVDRDEAPAPPESGSSKPKKRSQASDHGYAYSALAEEEMLPPTEASILLSGEQLKLMIAANQHMITFQYEDMFMHIPTEEMAKLSITDDCQISIFLEKLDEDRFYILILMDEEVVDVPFYLHLPFAVEGALLTFEDGETVENSPSPLFEENYYFFCSSSGICSLKSQP